MPCKYLRIELDTTSPTVGILKSKAVAILGQDLQLSAGGKVLSLARQYLSRANITSGGVVDVLLCRPEGREEGEEGEEKPYDDNAPAPEEEGSMASPRRSPRKRSRPFILLPGGGKGGGISSRKR